jgi:cytochrome c biogenesis protein CcdA
MSLWWLGLTLGIADGMLNPCALAVLLFLTAYLMAIGLKRKCLFIGLIFILTIFAVYSLFMLGLLNIITLLGYLELVRMIIAAMVLIIGSISIKDFFWYGRGFTLEIPKSARAWIETLTYMATYPSAMLLGVLISFVEIPCAGAFPLIYVGILAEKATGILKTVYVLWYNLFFVLPLIILVASFYLGLLRVEKAEKLRIRVRRYMKGIAGLILLVLGFAMLSGWL